MEALESPKGQGYWRGAQAPYKTRLPHTSKPCSLFLSVRFFLVVFQPLFERIVVLHHADLVSYHVFRLLVLYVFLHGLLVASYRCTLFTTPARKADGHEKWIDFVLKFPRCECISKKSFSAFSKSYLSWCRKCGYNFSDSKAREIYVFACNSAPSLADSAAAHTLVSTAILQLNTLNETLASLQKEMDLLASSLPEYDTVMSLFGVGSVLGSQLIAEIGDVSRFSNKKALVGFAGIDAPPFQSGNFNPQSRSISKRGSAALRKTLFQIMFAILQNAPANEPVFLFMDKKRTEGKHFYVYMMAGANKFLRIYYARVMEHLNSLQEAA